jgi:hypothetical protein
LTFIKNALSLHQQTKPTTMKTKNYSISKTRAIEIAMNHNCVSIEIASNYTIGELKEVLRQLRINAKIV